jgi:hypothetical protein
LDLLETSKLFEGSFDIPIIKVTANTPVTAQLPEMNVIYRGIYINPGRVLGGREALNPGTVEVKTSLVYKVQISVCTYSRMKFRDSWQTEKRARVS